MNRTTLLWSVSELANRLPTINFPEYQREPNVWKRTAKQRLVDSILRRFDIASIYVYNNEDGTFDCIDGRQRIGAIIAFLGMNPDDPDNGFDLTALNEIYTDTSPFALLEGLTYKKIVALAASDKEGPEKPVAAALIQALAEYPLTVVELSGSTRPEEFNLQFTRLNLGTPINAGEKLNAMVGAMRDLCFDDPRIGKHAFFSELRIPTRRFSREQVAAQILAQAFAYKEAEHYIRARHFDLQRFFQDKAELDDEELRLVADISNTLDKLTPPFSGLGVLGNRAISVSVVLLAWKRGIRTKETAAAYAAFIVEFSCRLKWQIEKGYSPDLEYGYLLDFQRHVTQASVEKYAVQARADRLEAEYDRWTTEKEISGDAEYRARTGDLPSDKCRESKIPTAS